jgi:hypothetical protein
MHRILLRRRVILTDIVAFEVEREVDLPLPPFVDLRLENSVWSPPGCDESEDEIQEIAYDLNSGQILCFLEVDDYRPQSSGNSGWTEAKVRQHYQQWAVKRDEAVSSGPIERPA